MFEESPLTTEEIKTCCADLRLLNKSDFKMLLKWRLEVLKQNKEVVKAMKKEEGQEEEEEEKKEEKEEETSTEQQLQEVREKIAVSTSARRVRRRWISVARSGRSARSWRRSASAVCWDWTSRLSRASASRCSVWRAWD